MGIAIAVEELEADPTAGGRQRLCKLASEHTQANVPPLGGSAPYLPFPCGAESDPAPNEPIPQTFPLHSNELSAPEVERVTINTGREQPAPTAHAEYDSCNWASGSPRVLLAFLIWTLTKSPALPTTTLACAHQSAGSVRDEDC